MEAASQAEDTALFPSAGTAADALRSPKALKMTSLPALMMSITVTPGFRSRRESATLSQQHLGVTVLGFSLEAEKCLYTCDAFNWEKELS